MFPIEIDNAYQEVVRSFIDVLIEHLDDQPTCTSPLREKILQLQAIYRKKPDAALHIKRELAKTPIDQVEIIDQQRRAEAFVSEINAHIQMSRVLCVSSKVDSDHMWRGYADEYRGVALRIAPNYEKDSKFKLFRPVTYRERRPAIYDEPAQFLSDSLFGNQEKRITDVLYRVVYTKTLEWRNENEYRLVIPVFDGEKDWDTLPYLPEEVTGIYLGENMSSSAKEEIGALAKEINPSMEYFCASSSGSKNTLIEKFRRE